MQQRPRSLFSHRQKSSDIRDLQSKSKHISNKHRKQSLRKRPQYTPYHVESQRRLIIENLPPRQQFKDKKSLETETQRPQRTDKPQKSDKLIYEKWRHGVVRFIQSKVGEKDYHHFIKLFDVWQRLQACKKQIFCHHAKYGKESGNSQRNQELTEMEKKEYKLLAEQQKILLNIEQSNNEKQNAVLQSFKNATTTSKPSSLMTSTEPLSELKSIENSQNVFIEKNPGSKHKRKQSDMSKKSSKQTPNGVTQRGSEYLVEIMELIWNLDEKMRVNVPDRSVGMNNNEWMVKGIKGWVRRKLEIIEELYVSVARLCKVAKGEFAGHEWMGVKELGNKGKKGQGVQKQSQENMQNDQIMKSPKSYYQHQQSYNKSFKSQTLKNLQKNLNEIQKSHINVNSSPNSQGVWNMNNEGTIGSFNGMFCELEKYIKEISHMKGVSERNKQLAKQLITLSKEINQEKQTVLGEKQHKQRVQKEKISLEKQLVSLKKQYESQVITVKRENQLVKKDNELVKKDNELVKKRNQKLDQDNTKLLNEIHKMKTQIHELTNGKQTIQKQLENMRKQNEKVERQLQKANRQVKQGEKYEKYYRESLSLEKEVKILSQQNQKLLNQLKHTKQQYDQLVANTTRKEEQVVQQNNKTSQQSSNNLNIKQILNSHQDTTTNKKHGQSISMMNSHQKSIKQSTNTSLMYKQQEKNMKKLNDQNKKLEETNRQLQQEIKQLTEDNFNLINQNKKLTQSNMTLADSNNSLTEENHAISQLNHKLNQQTHKLIEENKNYQVQRDQFKEERDQFKEENQEKSREIKLLEEYNTQLCEQSKRIKQENTRVHQENKRIEEQFEYVLNQKLQLQSFLGTKTKQLAKINSEKQNSRIEINQKIAEIHERVQQLMGAREQVRRQIQLSKESVREMFECISEEITSAFAIFVNSFSTQLAAKHSQQISTQTQMSTQTHQLQLKEQYIPQTAYQNQSQSQQQLLKEQSQIPLSITNQQYEEQIMSMTQQYQTMAEQYQTLVEELNHCIYQLNTYKSMLEQVQIQKQLQKKYLEQDITQLKHQLTFNKHEFTHSAQQPTTNVNTNKSNKLKINCESFSITIIPQIPQTHSQIPQSQLLQIPQSSEQIQTFTHVQSQEQPQLEKCQEEFISLQQWLQQVKFDSQTSTQPFTSFCSFAFNSSHAQTTSTYKSLSPSTLKQINDLKLQNQCLKLQIEKLKQENFLQKSSSLSQYRSPLKEIFSPSQKTFSQFENTHEVEQMNNKMNMMGSLYNNFSFPKLVSKISHQQQSTQTNPNYDPLNAFETKQLQQQPQQKQYPPLQMASHKQTERKPKKPIQQKENQLSDNTSSGLSIKALSHLQDEDESFDLCII